MPICSYFVLSSSCQFPFSSCPTRMGGLKSTQTSGAPEWPEISLQRSSKQLQTTGPKPDDHTHSTCTYLATSMRCTTRTCVSVTCRGRAQQLSANRGLHDGFRHPG